MSELRKLDEVAYVRFASVYRSFQDINEFKEEIDRLSADQKGARENNACRFFPLQDRIWMARAIQLADQGRYTTQPNPRVGCVIVRDGEMVGEGFHVRAGEGHAEVNALRMAGDLATWGDCVCHPRTVQPLWSSTPPCAEALAESRWCCPSRICDG